MVNVGATSQIKAHIRWNTSTGTCVGSQCSTNSPSHQAEFSVPHVALFHSIYEEDAAFWQYNSCVEFTFRGRGDSNTREFHTNLAIYAYSWENTCAKPLIFDILRKNEAIE